MLTDVGSYGKQLGKIGDALIVLLNHFEPHGLTRDEKTAIEALRGMLEAIGKTKEGHGRHAMRPVRKHFAGA